MIQLSNVRKVYQTEKILTLALDDIDLEVKDGEFVSVMGPSGCGKSTLLNMIGLLDAPTEGRINIAGQEVSRLGDIRRAHYRNEYIGFVFQQFHLIRELSVLDNVEIPLLYRRVGRKERRKRCLDALEQVGLSSRIHHRPTQLSGGQQQRVAIARAIVGQPKILLADEPTGNLDSTMGDEIMKILHDLNASGTTIVMVTHDRDLAKRTMRVVHLFDGRQIH
ncbi:MAG: ABC transporter ATP-binding protein [bacterium]